MTIIESTAQVDVSLAVKQPAAIFTLLLLLLLLLLFPHACMGD